MLHRQMVQSFSAPRPKQSSFADENELQDGREEKEEEVIRMVGPAVKYSDGGCSIRSIPPGLGQHSRQVLQELGYTSTEMAELLREGHI